MSEKYTYHGRVFCTVLPENAEYNEGMRGAFIPICCLASSYSEAIKKIESELLEIQLKLDGADDFYDDRFFEGVPSKEMIELIQKLESYPVQFKDVHYFPPDS